MSKNSRAHNKARKQKSKSSAGPSLSRKNSIRQPEVLELVKYEIVWEAIEELPVRGQSDEDVEQINAIGEDVLKGEKSRKLLAEIESMIERFPEIPKLYNYKSVVLMRMKKQDEVNRSILETVERFPDYLFAKTNYCQILLEDGRVDEVDRILGGEFRIDRHLEGRTRIHVSEFRSWNCLMVRYGIAKGNLELSASHMDMLEEIDPDHPEVAIMRRKFMWALYNSYLPWNS